GSSVPAMMRATWARRGIEWQAVLPGREAQRVILAAVKVVSGELGWLGRPHTPGACAGVRRDLGPTAPRRDQAAGRRQRPATSAHAGASGGDGLLPSQPFAMVGGKQAGLTYRDSGAARRDVTTRRPGSAMGRAAREIPRIG